MAWPGENVSRPLLAALIAGVGGMVYAAWVLYAEPTRLMLLPPVGVVCFLMVWIRRPEAFFMRMTLVLITGAFASAAVPTLLVQLQSGDTRFEAKLVNAGALFSIMCLLGATVFGVLEYLTRRRIDAARRDGDPPKVPPDTAGAFRPTDWNRMNMNLVRVGHDATISIAQPSLAELTAEIDAAARRPALDVVLAVAALGVSAGAVVVLPTLPHFALREMLAVFVIGEVLAIALAVAILAARIPLWTVARGAVVVAVVAFSYGWLVW